MDNDAMIMIMDYKDYKVMINKLFSFTSLISDFVSNGYINVSAQGEERPFMIAFKHGLEEEKV